MSGSLSLMALAPLPEGGWLQDARIGLEKHGLTVRERAAELLVWPKKERMGGLAYADGWVLRRMWLAPKRSAVGVTGRRIYFEPDTGDIDKRQEHLIISGNRPAPRAATDEVEAQISLLECLRRSLGPKVAPVQLEPLGEDITNARLVQIRDESFAVPPAKLDALYRQHGFDADPKGFAIGVCPLESVTESIAGKFVERLHSAAEERNVRMQVRCVRVEKVERRLQQLATSMAKVQSGKCVLFILPTKATEPCERTVALFARLQSARVPFRRAYADDPLRYSIPDQLPSLILASGGRPHRSPTVALGTPVWTVGVDLGHALRSSSSVLALTLVDPEGALAGAWTSVQRRDETASADDLTAMLRQCNRRIREVDPHAGVVVLRDGRLFENEDAQLYGKELNAKTSLFEYRKGGNPQIIQTKQAERTFIAPIACIIPSSSTMFISTLNVRGSGSPPAVVKVTWRSEWNGLGLDAGTVARVLTASAAAPGLGLQPRHHPAAIYWADGIAGTSSADLRFVGVVRQEVLPGKMEHLEAQT